MTIRRIAPTVCGFSLLGLFIVGCATGPLARREGIPVQNATAEQMVEHLNQNARAVQSIQCDNVAIQAKQGSQSIGIDGQLAYQKPRSFRLIAKQSFTTEADMGSNDREFWFWIKRADQPGLYHCAYEDLPNCRNLSIPIQPDWVAEALGATELGAPGEYRVNNKGKLIELVRQTTSPQGQPLQRITTIDRASGRVVRHDLIGSNGPIWTAHIDEYHSAKVAGHYSIPRKVRIVCPAERMELRLKLDGCKINHLNPGNTPPQLFAMPNMPGVPAYDLARGRPNAQPQSLRQVRGRAE